MPTTTNTPATTKEVQSYCLHVNHKFLFRINEGIPTTHVMSIASSLVGSCNALLESYQRHPTEDLAYLIRFVTSIASDLIEACSEDSQ